MVKLLALSIFFLSGCFGGPDFFQQIDNSESNLLSFSENHETVLSSQSGDDLTVGTIVPDGLLGDGTLQVEIGSNFSTSEATTEIGLDGFEEAGDSIAFGTEIEIAAENVQQIQVSIPYDQGGSFLYLVERKLIVVYHIFINGVYKIGYMDSTEFEDLNGRLYFFLKGLGHYQPVWVDNHPPQKEAETEVTIRIPKESDTTIEPVDQNTVAEPTGTDGTTRDPTLPEADTVAPGLPLVANPFKIHSSSTSQLINWDAPSDSDLSSYTVKVCLNSSCDLNCSAVSTTTNLSLQVNGLAFNKSYYGCVATVDTSGNHSPFTTSSSPYVIKSPGSLDPDFAGTGRKIKDSVLGGSAFDSIYAGRHDQAGNYVVVGSSFNGTSNDIFVQRYLPNGVLDDSFGQAGTFTKTAIVSSMGDDTATSLAFASDGGIYVGGASYDGVSGDDIFIVKLTAQGTLDQTFNGSGIVTKASIAGGTGDDRIQGIAVDAADNIFITGFTDNGISLDMFVMKYTASGAIDTSFGSLGKLIRDTGGADRGNTIVLDRANNLLVAGYQTNEIRDAFICKYLANGDPDLTFASSGCFVHDSMGTGTGSSEIQSIKIDSSDRIVATGSINGGNNDDLGVWRLSKLGALDLGFNGTGYATHDSASGGNDNDLGQSLAINSLNEIFISGSSFNGQTNNVVWKYKVDGTLDPNFAGGYVVMDTAGQPSYGESIDISPITKSLMIGGRQSASNGNFDIAIWSLLP